jgi:hypothetical protein
VNTLTLALSTLCIVSLIFFLAHEALCDRKKIKIEEIKLMQAGDKSQSYLRYVVLPSPENVYMDAAEHGWYDSVDRN